MSKSTLFVKKLDPSVVRGRISEKVDLAVEKWKNAIKNHRISSLEARIELAKVDMMWGNNTPSSRAVAAADKAEAEMLLAKIEMDDAKEELSRYPTPISGYSKLPSQSHEV